MVSDIYPSHNITMTYELLYHHSSTNLVQLFHRCFLLCVWAAKASSFIGDRLIIEYNMRQLLLKALSLPLSIITAPVSTPHCKTYPHNETWPSLEDWNALNKSIGGSLLRVAPAASSC